MTTEVSPTIDLDFLQRRTESQAAKECGVRIESTELAALVAAVKAALNLAPEIKARPTFANIVVDQDLALALRAALQPFKVSP